FQLKALSSLASSSAPRHTIDVCLRRLFLATSISSLIWNRNHFSRHAFSAASISLSLMERSREKSWQRTQPDASVTTLNLFWQCSRHAQIAQNFFSVPMIL
ncbi:MAG: hypothetical protein JXB13_10850, partial [Phycisphaerae bacterium]|nr:hypothetical protein [Phycisphaerae bacterium]